MVTRSTAEARSEFSELLNTVSYNKERVVLTRRGKPVAAVVPVEDLDLLQEFDDRLDIRDAEAAKAEGTPIAWEDAKADLRLLEELEARLGRERALKELERVRAAQRR